MRKFIALYLNPATKIVIDIFVLGFCFGVAVSMLVVEVLYVAARS